MNEMNDDPSLEELASSLALPKDATLPTTTMAAFTADEFDPQPVTSVVDAQRVYRQTVTQLRSSATEEGANSQAATLASMPMGFCWAMADFRGKLAGVLMGTSDAHADVSTYPYPFLSFAAAAKASRVFWLCEAGRLDEVRSGAASLLRLSGVPDGYFTFGTLPDDSDDPAS